MITVVITSCGRLELLKRTIDSFREFNTYPVTEFILVDDSGKKDVHDYIKDHYSDFTLILETHNRGQVKCIDDAYSRVKTPYIFHLEDDWQFLRHSFLEPSLKILEFDPDIMMVWTRPNGFPIEPETFTYQNINYQLLGHEGNWHGFVWNPALRRLSDYETVKPYSQWYAGKDSAIHEAFINKAHWDYKNFKVVILKSAIENPYCIHIGEKHQVRPTGE